MRSSWHDFPVPNRDSYQPFQVRAYADSSDPDQTLYLTLPREGKKHPLVIFFHGGGMTGGDRECPDEIYDGRFAVAEPRYRLSPAAKAPAQIEDAARAIAWCFAHAEELGIDRSRIFIGGMSAGSYLAAISVMNPKFLAPYGLHYREIAGLLLISGQMTTHFHIKADLGRDNGPYNPLVDEYAPLGNLAADLPPILMVTGESGLDMPARPEENAFMAASLRAIGHKFVRCYQLPGHHHGAALDSCGFLVMTFINQVLMAKEACHE